MSVCPTCRTQCEEGLPLCPVDGTALPARAALLGAVLGERYRLLSRIGGGGMGTVYLAEHVALGKRVAVKVLRPEYSREEEVVRRFEQEARAASRIGHENIVDVVDFGRAPDGSLYFAMEALEGESLARLMKRQGALPVRRALLVLAQICRALGAAHARGVVHRDLKPENVQLVPRDDGADLVKVLDFGISKTRGLSGGDRITRAGSIIGTPEYMAPEQAMGLAVDHRCDVYALGVLAYEMLTGTLPFQGDTPLATLLKHQSEAPEPPRRRRPGLPPAVEAMVLKALSKRPQGRQRDMAEVAADLSRALAAAGVEPPLAPPFELAPPQEDAGRFPTPGRSTPRGETLTLDAIDVVAASPLLTASAREAAERSAPVTPIPSFDRARRRPRAVLLGGAVAVALGGAGAGAVLLRGWEPIATPASTPVATVTATAALTATPAPATNPAATPTSVPAAPPLRVTLRSVPPGAEVFRGEERVGQAPLEVELDPGGEAEYRFALGGYRPEERLVRASDGDVEVRLGRTAAARPARPRRPSAEEPDPYGKVDDLKPDPFR